MPSVRLQQHRDVRAVRQARSLEVREIDTRGVAAVRGRRTAATHSSSKERHERQ